MPKPKEIWKTVPSKPRIEVSSFGRIRRKSHRKKMPHGGSREYRAEPKFGYITRASKSARHEFFGVYYRGIGNVKVHRAVCEAFNGPPPPDKPVVIHKNENSLDNRPENLCWGTQKENLNAPGFIEFKSTKLDARSDLMEEICKDRVVEHKRLADRLGVAPSASCCNT